ncbi:phosphopantetheine binding protein [Krasilnikovia cinnamomea]|uniref:Phosphopantetheine binding protein n=1 Tax=Krasilnikovia cinnamomea TaxID=349313 RepID=A0A4Q7ZJ95_9ACTN|nr:phosphopantetheine-binding protein [Krasilnikovia cinnamomea]RZU50932.1 phosphopantetheine binding protein [Krasilnikovia cinnamomea]
MRDQTVVDVVFEEWRSALGAEHPAEDDDFFAAGGDSQLALQMVSRIERRLDIRFPLEVLFIEGTLGSVLNACEERVSA